MTTQSRRAVLVIEDGKPFMRLMVWSLGQDGFDVHSASLEECSLAAAQLRPAAVVFNMHDEKGKKRDCIAELREIDSEICVVDVHDGEEPDTGADGYLPSPVIAEDLKKMIVELCGGRL